RDTLKLIRLEAPLAWCEIWLRVDHQLRKLGLVKRFDTRSERRVAQNKNRRTVFARDPGRFNRDVETIFDARCCEHNARAVAVAAEDRSEEHTSELQSRRDLVCRLLLEKKKK